MNVSYSPTARSGSAPEIRAATRLELVDKGEGRVFGDVAARPFGLEAVNRRLTAPNELVLVWMHGSDDDLEAELASWTDPRGEEQASR